MERKSRRILRDYREFRHMVEDNEPTQETHETGGHLKSTSVNPLEIGFMFFFWCANLANIISFLCFVIPEYLSDYSATSRNVLKLLVIFVHTHIIANWFLTRKYESSLKQNGNELAENHDRNHSVDEEENKSLNVSRKFCHICKLTQPQRTHHCKVCNVCIMKRDHHCFMTGVCIGFKNQRHFILLNFYIGVTSICGLISSYLYMTSDLGPQCNSVHDYMLPYITYKWLTGQIYIQHVLFSFLLYTFCWSPFVSLGFFTTQIIIVAQGKTLHELKKGIKVPNGGSVRTNFQSVFGHYWLLNFFIPVHLWFKQQGSGLSWTCT